jgi:hypothetical protein
MTKRNEIQQAQIHLESFVRHQTGEEDHEALIALEKGLAILTDIMANDVEEKDRTLAATLFNTYARRTEELVTPFLYDADMLPSRVYHHWYRVMKEFEDSEIPLSETFIKKENLLFLLMVKEQIKKLPKAYQKALDDVSFSITEMVKHWKNDK